MRAEQAQARSRKVPAVLLQDAPQPVHALSQAALDPLVRARWTAPGGAPREGEVYAPGGARAGTIVMVWTDGSGTLKGAPLQRADVAAREAIAAFLARPPWRSPGPSPAGRWTSGGWEPGMPTGHGPARNGPAACDK